MFTIHVLSNAILEQIAAIENTSLEAVPKEFVEIVVANYEEATRNLCRMVKEYIKIKEDKE